MRLSTRNSVLLLLLSLIVLLYGVQAQETSDSVGYSEEVICDPILGCGETSQAMLLFSLLLILSGAVLIVYILVTLNLHYIPESVAVVVYGILIGITLRFTNTQISIHLASFDPQYFFLYILPAIIFETGFSMSKTAFFKNIIGILLLAFLGTFISYLVMGFGIWAVGKIGASYPLPLRESLILGSILSVTDPVATLSIFQAFNVDQTLYMLVLGESMMNDAMGIILYKSSIDYKVPNDILKYLWEFLLFSFGSVLLGVGIAIILSLLLRNINIGKFPALETIFMLMFSYMSYVLADALSLSAILSVFWCGIVFNHYGAYSLSPYSKLTSRQLFRMTAFICEMCVFIYIGISIATVQFDFDLSLTIWAVVFCLIGRAMNVYPIMGFMNLVFPKTAVSPQVKFVLWFAGLRGAVAFSLSLDLKSNYSQLIRTVTLITVHVTLFVFGCSTLPLLKVLKIRSASSAQSLDNMTKLPEKSEESRQSRYRPKRFYNNLDERFFKKWFRRPIPPVSQDAVELFERLVSGTYEYELKVPNDTESEDGFESRENENGAGILQIKVQSNGSQLPDLLKRENSMVKVNLLKRVDPQIIKREDSQALLSNGETNGHDHQEEEKMNEVATSIADILEISDNSPNFNADNDNNGDDGNNDNNNNNENTTTSETIGPSPDE